MFLAKENGMKYRRLGRTGLLVSSISLGSWTTYGGSVADEQALRIIRKAFDSGINLFDTADVYERGAAESVLGRAIKDLPREQIVIATKCRGKVWDGPLGEGLSRQHILDACDRSLKRLGIDHIDLYQLHWPDFDTPIEESLLALEDLVRWGKVRYVGYSNYDHHVPLDRDVLEIQKKRNWSLMASSQPRYSLLDRHIESSHLPLCQENQIGLIVYSPLAQGVLTNKYAGGQTPAGSRATTPSANFLKNEFARTPENVIKVEHFATWCSQNNVGTPAQIALAWVLRNPHISSAIIGATTELQLEENVHALEISLSEKQWGEVESFFKQKHN